MFGAPVDEDENGPAARRIRRHRRHRAEDRIVVVLPRHHDPHVDAFTTHERRQDRLEPAGNPAVLHRRLLPMGEHAVDGQGLTDRQKFGAHCDGSEDHESAHDGRAS